MQETSSDLTLSSSKTRKWTPLHSAAVHGYDYKVRELLEEGEYDVNCVNDYGDTPLHIAAKWERLGVVRMLIQEFKAIVDPKNGDGNTPFYHAIQNSDSEAVALSLLNEFDCDTLGGTPFIHEVCRKNWLYLIQALVHKHGFDILNHHDSKGNTPLHEAARQGKKEAVILIISEYHCDTSIKGHKGRSLLHSACEGGDVSLVQTLILEHKGNITARDDDGNTPLHVAAEHGREDVLLALVSEFDSKSTVKNFSSLWMVNSDGDSPLHMCSRRGHVSCVQALLRFSPPVMIRNSSGQTPPNVAHKDAVRYFDDYMQENRTKIFSQYQVILRRAKKKYFLAQCITRVFVIGNPGAGKSSLIESLKREGFFSSLLRVSESSVPPHTAGIVPSIHTSKHYGRVLFYDFAGDAEYYSSHAAILENIASSTKGDNIFIIVVDLREDMAKIRNIFQYWVSFVQYQQFSGHKPHLIAVGSHLDLLTTKIAMGKKEQFQRFCESLSASECFMLDCCKPRSRQILDIQKYMVEQTRDSPQYELSFQASVLLGILEQDFSYVPTFATKQLLAHIEETGIDYPSNIELLRPILLELHELGLLFIIDSNCEQLVLNMSHLTNIVHKSLFSAEACQELNKTYNQEGLSFSFSAGVIPHKILAKILPKNIAKECLVKLQYCQEISHNDIHAFPSIKASDSPDQSFLFFPALCSADKSDVEWVTPPDLSYGIGWLARCTDLCDYFPPRFLHVLLLRLVFRFTLSAHSPPDQVSRDSPDHSVFQRRCTMWKTGVHWLMEEGVECLVELVNANKEVVVLTRSIDKTTENCATVFNSVVNCVMEAKAEFCHSAKLEFFLLNSTDGADYLRDDNLFMMIDVERVLGSSEEKKAILSLSGKRHMERSKLLCLLKFTLWHSLFPIDSLEILAYLKDVVTELDMLGLLLNIPQSVLRELETDFPFDVSKRRVELVNWWMSSSPDPPCWWHLVQALDELQDKVLAEEIREQHSPQVQLQEKLLSQHNHSLRPDAEFLQSFADVVGSKWPSLAASLSLSGDEIEEVKGEGLTQHERALKMLRKWATKESATYGQLYQTLKTIPLFQQCSK